MPNNRSGNACQPQKNLPDDNHNFTLEDLDYLDAVILPHEINLLMKHCSDLLQGMSQQKHYDPKH